jgi:hypothetical protein
MHVLLVLNYIFLLTVIDEFSDAEVILLAVGALTMISNGAVCPGSRS